MDINFIEYMPYLASVVTCVFGWVIGKKRQDNAFITELQNSINLLAKDNRELREELNSVLKENTRQSVLLERISEENKLLKEQLNKLSKRLSSKE